MSGSSFAAVFAITSTLGFIISVLPMKDRAPFVSPYVHFYIVGIPYMLYALFCLHTYRQARELCFYCKFALVQNPLTLLLLLIFRLNSGLPWLYLWIAGIGLFVSLIIRGLKRKTRAKEM